LIGREEMKDEFEWIKSISPSKTYQPSLIQGIGDDAAVYEGSNDKDEIVCMDTMVEEIHFNRRTMQPFHIGFKALAANLSDIAAMGGLPLFYLVSIAIPSDWSVKELNEIYKGMDYLASKYEVDLVGGDTVSTKKYLTITVTVLGRVKKGDYVLRSNANPGDIVFVTGNIGDSAYGLSLLLDKGLDADYSDEELKLIEAHQMPIPQIISGLLLQETKANTSLNDISDGLASEINEIAEASSVKITIDYNLVPVSNYISKFPVSEQTKWTLYGGEDYQLVGTIDATKWHHVKQVFKERNLPITKIGKVEKGQASTYININGKNIPLAKGGFNHFNKQGEESGNI
jgi:thiamine-monophosphate kinase